MAGFFGLWIEKSRKNMRIRVSCISTMKKGTISEKSLIADFMSKRHQSKISNDKDAPK